MSKFYWWYIEWYRENDTEDFDSFQPSAFISKINMSNYIWCASTIPLKGYYKIN